MEPRNDIDAYLATSPLLHSFWERLVFEVIVSNNVGCSEALEILLDIGEANPTKGWVGKGSWNRRYKTHLFRMKLIVFNSRSLASVITACPTYID